MAVKVIFFTYAYPPLKYPRSVQIARLVKHSTHDIHVIRCEDESPKDMTIDGDIQEAAAELTVFKKEPFTFLRPGHLLDYLQLPDQHRSWALNSAKRLIENGHIEGKDVLVTFGQPMSSHLAGLKVKRATGVPWIAHFSDPWVDNPFRRHFPLLSWLNRTMERSVIAEADRLVFSSGETSDVVMMKYPPAWKAKAGVMPHAFDPSLYEDADLEQNRLILRYIGNFYGKRTPQPFVDALQTLHREQPEILNNLRAELVGKIDTHFTVPGEIPPGLLTILPSVDYLDSLRLMRTANLLLVIDAPYDQNIFLPSKLIDYIGAGRPIFAITPPGETSKVVERLGGYVANPKNIPEVVQKLASAITSLRNVNPEVSIKEDIRSEFEASFVTARMDRLIEELAQKDNQKE
jgi:hypothetical protein